MLELPYPQGSSSGPRPEARSWSSELDWTRVELVDTTIWNAIDLLGSFEKVVKLEKAAQSKDSATEAASRLQTLLWMNIDGILDQVPAATAIDRTHFQEKFGKDAADQLEKVGLISITNTSKPGQQAKFVLVFNAEGTIDTKNGTLTHANTVSFSYSKKPNGEVDLDNMNGLTCRGKHGITSLGTAEVDDVSIVHEPNGNMMMTGQAHWTFIHRTGQFEFGPDGKQIEKPPTKK